MGVKCHIIRGQINVSILGVKCHILRIQVPALFLHNFDTDHNNLIAFFCILKNNHNNLPLNSFKQSKKKDHTQDEVLYTNILQITTPPFTYFIPFRLVKNLASDKLPVKFVEERGAARVCCVLTAHAERVLRRAG